MSIEDCTAEDLDYIWQNLREPDRREVELQGLTNENYKRLLDYPEALVGKYQGTPVCFFALCYTDKVVYLICIATEQIYSVFKYFHVGAMCFVETVRQRHWNRRILVEVWEEHNHSIKWLKRLGFKPKFRWKRNNANFFMMEL